jgi:SAM-dependent methyltransferase
MTDHIHAIAEPVVAAFIALHQGLPRQGPGSDATTRRLLGLAGPLPPRPRVLDIGCGPGRASLLLAQEAGAEVTALDLHQPFLDELTRAAAARAAGYDVVALHPLPDSDWFEEYYTPLSERADAADLTVAGMREAVAATLQEITMRREHGTDYQYTGYVLRPQASTEKDSNTPMTTSWMTRPETAADLAQIREVNLAAFPTSHEADLVEALRADPEAWISGLSWVAEAPDGAIAGFALLTRCHVDGFPALTLGRNTVSVNMSEAK